MNIIEFLRRLLGLEKSIAKITSPIGKIVRDLEKHADRHTAKSEKAKQAAARQQELADLAKRETEEAVALAENYRGLVKG